MTASNPNDAQKILDSLRDSFREGRHRHPALRCFLIQAEQAEQPRLSEFPPGFQPSEVLQESWDIYRDLRVLSDESGNPLVTDQPAASDVSGKPITNSAGESFAVDFPAYRRTVLLGDLVGRDLFLTLATDVGAILRDLPESMCTSIDPCTLGADCDWLRWVWTVFDLAWNSEKRSLLNAKRWVWQGNVKYCYSSEELRRAATLSAEPPKYLQQWAEQLPGFYFSKLDDAFGASVHAVEQLLSEIISADPSKVCDKDLLTLDQIAKQVGLKKRSITKPKYRNALGPPDFKARGRLPNRWRAKNAKLIRFLQENKLST